MRIFRLLILFVALWSISIASRAAPMIEVQGGPRAAVRVARVAPDGTRLATLDGKLLQLWTRDGGVLWTRGVSGDSRALAWSSDGQKLAVGFGGTAGFSVHKQGDSAGALELDARDGHLLRRLLSGNNTFSHLDYLRDGRLLTQGDGNLVWDAQGNKTPLQIGYGTAAFATPDKNLVAIQTSGVQLWTPDLSAQIASLWRKGMPVGEFAWAPDNRHFAVADESHVQLWDAQTRAFEREIALPKGAAQLGFNTLALAWTPDSQTLLVARTDFPDYKDVENQGPDAGKPRLNLWRIARANGELITLRANERRALAALDFWPDGTLIWGGSTGDDPAIWAGDLNWMRLQARAVEAIWSAPQPQQAPRALQISPDGATLAVSGDDTAIRLWNLKSGRLEKSLKVFSSSIPALCWSPSGRQIAALDYENLFIFDVASGQARKFAGTPIYYDSASVTWSPDEEQLAFDGGEGAIILDVASGKTREMRQMDAQVGFEISVVGPLRWTSAGLEASGGLELVDPKTGRILRELDGSGVASERAPRGATDAFAWFDQGRGLLTLGGDDDLSSEGDVLSVKRWDVAANRVERTLRFGFDARVLALAPDETVFAVGGDDGQIALYDRKTLEMRWSLSVGNEINALSWSGASDTLFAASNDGWTYILGRDGQLRGRLAALPAPKPASTGYQWIHLASDLSYVASEKAAPLLRWRENGELRPLDTLGAATETLPVAQVVPLKIVAGLTPQSEEITTPKVAKTPGELVQDQPTLVLQGKAVGQFRDVAVSPGARWVVTHNEDQSVTLWDGRANLQWGELKSLRDRVPLFFSPDGTLLFCAPTTYPGDGEIYQSLEVHRVPNGELVRSFKLQSPYWSDGKIMRGIQNGAVESYNLSDGKRVAARQIAGLPTDNNRLAFSPDGNLIVAGADFDKDRVARVWRVSDGQKTIEIADKERVINAAAVSSDGRFLATEGEDPNWSPPIEAASEAAYARTFKIHLWDARTKKVLFSYDGYYSLSGGVQLLRFSPDGKALLSAGKDGDLRRLDTANGRVIAIPATPANELSPLDWPVAVAPDAQSGAGRTRDDALATVDIANGKLGESFAGPLGAPEEAFWSPDGKYIFGGGALFDAHTGALLGQSEAYTKDLLWRENELWMASLQSVTRWSVPDLKKLDEWPIKPAPEPRGSDDYSDGVRFSPDGTRVLTTDPKGAFGGGKPGLWVWDAQTHQHLRTLIPDFERGDGNLDALVFFPDGQKMLRPTPQGMEEWDLNSGERLRFWRDPGATDGATGDAAPRAVSSALLPVAVSPDARLIAARANRNNTILIFDADLDASAPPLQLLVRAGYRAQFLKDGHTLLLQNGANWQLWDARGDGKTPLRILGATGDKMRLSPDEKLASFGGYGVDGLRIWDIARDAEAVRLYTVRAKRVAPPNGWIALTPSGFYDASPAGEARLRWREGGAFWPLEKSRAQFFNPGAVRAALNP